MEIHIGRDPQTTKLKLTSDGKEVLYGPGYVPDSVLKEHCLIEVNGNDMRVRNLDINAFTYVNGQPIESKAITRDDNIALGKAHYVIAWDALTPFLPTDIRPLQAVWNKFDSENIALQIAERKFNTLRSATGLITMAAIALSIITGGRSLWFVALYALAIVLSLFFFVKAYHDSSKVPHRRKELEREFQQAYTCPHCGHFLGNQPYHILQQNSCCPYCKTKFIH